MPLNRAKEAAKLILGCVLLTVCLGIALDLVTANVAVTYFTVHHPHVIDSESPWAMALLWGVIASWWFGLIGGCLLAIINWFRAAPVGLILRKVAIACAVLWGCFMAILATIYSIGGLVPLAKRGPGFEDDRRLTAVAVTHMGEYVLGGIVIVILMIWLWRLPAGSDSVS